MIRLIVKRRQTCRISGLDREWFETFDADLPEVERALGGGFGENGSLAGSVIGAEVITELPQDAGDGARVTEVTTSDLVRKLDKVEPAARWLLENYQHAPPQRMAQTCGELAAFVTDYADAMRALAAREGGAS